MSYSVDEMIIQPATKRVKLDESENEDRLSDLPDCVILHILSFLNAKQAVTTSILSLRWRDLWKLLPALILDSSDFRTIPIFNKFVHRVLTLRDSSLALNSLNFRHNQPRIIKSVVNYAISHNIQRLRLYFGCHIAQIPPSVFSCQTLTHLELYFGEQTLFPKSLNLPSLTSLYLKNFAFCADENGRAEPFSAFNRLNSLFLCGCAVRDTLTLCISSATLVSFTVRSHSYDFYEIELCTPSLGTFGFTGKSYKKIFGSGLSCVKHVDIDVEIFHMDMQPSLILLGWLLGLTDIKSLTVTASTLQVLSLNSNISKTKLPSLGNLKLLKVKKKPLAYGFRKLLIDIKVQKIRPRKEGAKLRKSFKAGLEPSAPIPDAIVDFLIQNSPLADVEIVDCTWRKTQSTS